MKRNLTLVFLCMLLLVSLAGCRDANQFKETTLTFVNESQFNVNMLRFEGTWLASNMRPIDDSSDDDVIAPNESMTYGLPPILAEETQLKVGITYNDSIYNISCYISYEEGAEVVLTFNGQQETYVETFTVEGGMLVEVYK